MLIKRGVFSPSFFVTMITAKEIEKLVKEKLSESDNFLVSVEVKPGNQISIEIDNDNGLKVSDCVAVSRHVEGNLDREIEDFGLNVSSPGLGKPFKTERQYQKYISRKVEVLTNEGEVIQGVLISKNDDNVEVEMEIGKKGTKKKKEVVIIPLINIKETKSVISFK